MTVHRDKFLIIKPTRCTNFSNLFLEWNSTCFGQFLCPSSGVFHCTHGNCICHTVLLTACKLSANLYVLLCVQWRTPDDGQRNCPKHVDFHSKNKFEKLVRLVGFTVRKPIINLRDSKSKFLSSQHLEWWISLILRRSSTRTVWFYTSTSNKRAARPKLYTKSLTRDLKRMYSRFTLVRISINL